MILSLSQLFDALLWLLLIPAMIYIGGPILVWLTFKQRAYANSELIAPEELPEGVRQLLIEHSPTLMRQGFTAIAYVKHTGSVAGVSSYIAYWENSNRGHCAAILAVSGNAQGTKYSLEYETITSPQCKLVLTTNSSAATVYDKIPGRDVVNLSWLKNADELYRVHLFQEAKLLDASETRFLATADAVVDALNDYSYYVLRGQARLGLMRETTESGVFRLTLLGAVKMTYRLLPPFKQLRFAQSKQRAMQIYHQAMAIPPALASATPIKITTESPYEI